MTCAAVATPATSLFLQFEIRKPVPEPLGVEIRTTWGWMISTASDHWTCAATGGSRVASEGTRLESGIIKCFESLLCARVWHPEGACRPRAGLCRGRRAFHR